MFHKLVRIIYKNPLVVLSLLISIVAACISGFATWMAFESKNINKDNFGIQLDQISQNYTSKAYDEIYYNSDNAYVMKLLKDGSYVKDSTILRRVIDTFEGIGSGVCQGTIKFRHVRPYLYKSLLYICNNNQILDTFRGDKNGVAILCHELYPDSSFAKTIDMQNMSTCEFWDSLSFPQNKNRERFQTK